MRTRKQLKKLLHLLIPRKTRTKFFVTLVLVSLPPLLILGYFSYGIAKDRLVTYNTQTNETQLATSNEVADLLFRNILSLHRYIVYNHSVRDVLYEITEEAGNTSEQPVDYRNRLINLLSQIIHENSVDIRFINSLCVLDLQYTAYCFGKTDDAGIYEGELKKERIEASDWYQKVQQAQGGVVYFSQNVLGDNENSFSSVRLYRDSSTIDGNVIGMLIINVSKSMFQPVFNSDKENGHYMAVDFNAEPPQIIYVDHDDALPEIDLQSLEALKSSLTKQGYLMSEHFNRVTGWSFMHIIKREELLRDSQRIGSATALLATAIALLALIVSFIVSGSITRPLLRLKKMMMDWKQGIPITGDTLFQDDEIGSLGKTFSSIVKENQNLSDKLVRSKLKEREAELRALQEQIKPHFLYNTLDAIYLMARMKKTDEVAQMALSLSESFKLSLNKGKETIPIFRELQHIEHYMNIQNIRYNNRFSYHVEVDPQIMSIHILKLVLQPLVENAIYHGLEPKLGTGHIWLEGKMIGHELYFKIKDNGVGMSNIQATERGYGVNNVKERLKLYYGNSSRFVIASEVGVGTTIELYIIPFPAEERAEE
ncbi:hypothetical protein J40TS1_38570 [Paenibacillus montaniterrae]|uniref:Sensor histidine kinase n=1 Tax=Paenibacillus montaniterrae TaxID=429341 RepID=A0A920CZ96_9BACL|nr:sensor histidine kinase [Paenibacillus montaniterrae]GIP18215.1 hypothetical protein J40TS1_38570 [Paenibacillus montaniterrae]